jgi:CRISPR/Cas system type I-B associated protein Csh2 (Cas7 group RAMP superfamily)
MEEIGKQLSTIDNRNNHSPALISNVILNQHSTFMSLASNVASLHSELDQLKKDYTHWYQVSSAKRARLLAILSNDLTELHLAFICAGTIPISPRSLCHVFAHFYVIDVLPLLILRLSSSTTNKGSMTVCNVHHFSHLMISLLYAAFLLLRVLIVVDCEL